MLKFAWFYTDYHTIVAGEQERDEPKKTSVVMKWILLTNIYLFVDIIYGTPSWLKNTMRQFYDYKIIFEECKGCKKQDLLNSSSNISFKDEFHALQFLQLFHFLPSFLPDQITCWLCTQHSVCASKNFPYLVSTTLIIMQAAPMFLSVCLQFLPHTHKLF